MPVYLNINSANGGSNFLGITDGETAVVGAVAALVALGIGLGIITGGAAIFAAILAVGALYGILYAINQTKNAISNGLTNAYEAIANGLSGIGINNPVIIDILTTVLIAGVVCLLFYVGYEIYENI